jgi:hypothetical protein
MAHQVVYVVKADSEGSIVPSVEISALSSSDKGVPQVPLTKEKGDNSTRLETVNSLVEKCDTMSYSLNKVISDIVKEYTYCGTTCAAHQVCHTVIPVKEDCIQLLTNEYSLRGKVVTSVPSMWISDTAHDEEFSKILNDWISTIDFKHKCLSRSIKHTVLDTLTFARTDHNILNSYTTGWVPSDLVIIDLTTVLFEWIFPSPPGAYRLKQAKLPQFIPFYEVIIKWLTYHMHESFRKVLMEADLTTVDYFGIVIPILVENDYSLTDKHTTLRKEFDAEMEPFKGYFHGDQMAFTNFLSALSGPIEPQMETDELPISDLDDPPPINNDIPQKTKKTSLKVKAEEGFEDVVCNINTIYQMISGLFSEELLQKSTVFEKIAGFILCIFNVVKATSSVHRLTIFSQWLMTNGFYSICRLKDRILSFLPNFVNFVTTWTLNVGAIAFLGIVVLMLIRSLIPKKLVETTEGLLHRFNSDNLEDSVEDLVAQMSAPDEFLSWVKKFNIMKQAVQSGEYLSKLLVDVFYKVYFFVTGSPFVTTESEANVNKALNWLKRWHEDNIKFDRTTDLAASMSQCHRVVELYKEGIQIQEALTEKGYKETYIPTFSKALSELADVARECEFFIKNASTRPVPLWIHMVGEASRGKSALTQILCHDIWQYYTEFIIKRPAPYNANLRYERNPIEAFWSGYAHQFFTCIDDIFQLDDAEVRSRTATDLIHMVNCNPYNLNMGDLKDKGKTMFDSMVVLTNDNSISLPKNVHIQNVDAFKGRRDFVLKVDVYKKYWNDDALHARDKILLDEKELAPSRKIYGESKGDKFARGIYNFTLLDPITEAEVHKCNYSELICMIGDRLTFKQSNTNSVYAFASQSHLDFNAIRQNVKFRQAALKGEPVFVEDIAPQMIDRYTAPYIAQGNTQPVPKELAAFEEYRLNFQLIMDNNDVSVVGEARRVCEAYCVHRKQLESGVLLEKATPENIYELPNHAPPFESKYPSTHPWDNPSTIPAKRAEGFYKRPLTEEQSTAIERISASWKKCVGNARSHVKGFTAHIVELVGKCRSFCVGHWKILLTIPAVLGILGVVIKLFHSASKEKVIPQNETGASGGGYTGNLTPGNRLKPARFKLQPKPIVPHDSGTEDLLRSAVQRNGCYVRAHNDSSDSSLQTIFLFEKVCVFPRHFWDIVQSKIVFTPINPNRAPFTVFKAECDVLSDTENDLCMVKIQYKGAPFADISQHFYTADLLERCDLSSVLIYKNTRNAFDRITDVMVACNGGMRCGPVGYRNGKTQYNSATGVRYFGPFSKGDCGVLVSIANPRIQKRFVGIHVAGNDHQGRAAIITSEDIAAAKVYFYEGVEPQMITYETLAQPTYQYKHWKFIGALPPNLGVRFPSKSQIEKSGAFQLLQLQTKAPARLRPFKNDLGEIVSPLQLAITKMERPYGPPMDNALAAEIADRWFEQIVPRFPARVLDQDEAINGVLGSRFLGPIDLTTSIGFVGVQTHGLPHKGDWCVGLPGNIRPLEILQNRIDYLERAYVKLQTKVAITQVHLKDELRDLARVAAAKTRLFSCPEFGHLVLSKRYFGALLENIGIDAISLGVALGVNPSSYDWESIVAAKQQCKPTFELDGDSSCHDGNANITFLRLFAVCANRWYKIHDKNWKPEDDCVRCSLVADGSYDAVLQIGTDLVTVERFLASGVFWTFVFQSFTTHIGMRYTFIKAAAARGMTIPVSFTFKEMFVTAGGDDYVHSLSEKCEWYSFSIFQEYVRELGYEYTPPDKSTGTYEKRDVNDVDFLKRRFVKRDGYWFAPLELTTIREIISWKKVGLSDREAFASSAISVLYESYHHGRKIFDEHRSALIAHAYNAKIPLLALTYDEVESELCRFSYSRPTFNDEEIFPHVSSVPSHAVQALLITAEEAKSIRRLDINKTTSFANAYYAVFHCVPRIDFTRNNNCYLAILSFKDKVFKGPWSLTKRDSREAVLKALFIYLLEHAFTLDLDEKDYVVSANDTFFINYIKKYGATPEFLEFFVGPNEYLLVLSHGDQTFSAIGPTVTEAQNNVFSKFFDANIVAQMELAEAQVEQTEGSVETDGITTMKSTTTPECALDVGRWKPLYGKMDPYPDQGLSIVLGRKYRISDFTWTGSALAGYNIINFNFPYALASISSVWSEKVFGFKWLNCGFTVEFYVNGTQFHYGKLLIAWLPHNSSTSVANHWKLANMWTASASGAVTLSANTQQTVSICIPYTIPVAWYDTTRLGTNSGDIGTIAVYCLNPLSLLGSSSTPSVTVSVFATATDVTVAGPTVNPLTYDADNENFKNIVKNIPNLLKYSKPLSKEDDYESDLEPQSCTRELTQEEMESNSVSYLFMFSAVLWPWFLLAIYKLLKDQPLQAQMLNVNKEADTKAKTGLVSNILNTGSNIAMTVASSGLLGPAVSLGLGIAGVGGKALGKVAGMLGFNKPVSTAAPIPVQMCTVSGLANGNGTFLGYEMGMEEGGRISTDASSFLCKTLPVKLVELSSKPGLFAQTTFDATKLPGQVWFSHRVTPMTCYTTTQTTPTFGVVAALTPCAAVGSMFKYWRGTMKYRLELVCSKFTVGRIRITWHPTYAEIPAIGTTIGGGEGDLISTVIDFDGDTSFNFSVPYLRDTLYARCEEVYSKTEEGTCGGISYSIVIPAISGETTASTTVYANFYVATDDDMNFVQLCDQPAIGANRVRTYSTANNAFYSTISPQSDIVPTNVLDEIFLGSFPTLIPGVTATQVERVTVPETYDDIYTLVHKPVTLPITMYPLNNTLTLTVASPANNRLDFIPSVFANGGSWPMMLFMQWGLFYKGGLHHYVRAFDTNLDITDLYAVMFSVRNGVVQPPQQNVSPITLNFNNTPFVYQTLTDRGAIMFHTPYRSHYPFQSYTQNTYLLPLYNPEQATGIYFTGTGSEVSCLGQWSVSADDDFRFSWFMGPPLFVVN